MTRPNLNAVAIVPLDLDGSIGSTGFHVLRGKDTDSRFLFYAVQTPDFVDAMCRKVQGALYPAVRPEDISSFCLPPFSLAQQRRIVAKIEELFSELDKGIENLKQARAQLAVYRQSLLKHAFEGKLTAGWRAAHKGKLESADQLLARIHAEMPDKSENRGVDAAHNSCSWLKLTLAEIIVEALIGLVRASALQNRDGRGFSYIKMDRVDMSGHVDIAPEVFVDCGEEEVERFALREGDILFNTRNSVELVGKTGLVRKAPSAPTVFNNNLMRIRTVPPVLPAFLSHQMCAPQFRENMEQVKKATTSVAAVYGKDLWPPEKVAAEVARVIEVPAARVELAEFQGKRGTASLNFVRRDAGQDLVHGDELLGGHVIGYARDKVFRHSSHSIHNIVKAIGSVFTDRATRDLQLTTFAGFLVLDALIGNTDRHHQNWGVLRRTGPDDQMEQEMAPSFDHASSLGRNESDARLRRRLDENTVLDYARKGRGGIFWSSEDAKGANPLGLAERAARQWPQYFSPWLPRLAQLDDAAFLDIVNLVPPDWMSQIQREFCFRFLVLTRSELQKLPR